MMNTLKKLANTLLIATLAMVLVFGSPASTKAQSISKPVSLTTAYSFGNLCTRGIYVWAGAKGMNAVSVRSGLSYTTKYVDFGPGMSLKINFSGFYWGGTAYINGLNSASSGGNITNVTCA